MSQPATTPTAKPRCELLGWHLDDVIFNSPLVTGKLPRAHELHLGAFPFVLVWIALVTLHALTTRQRSSFHIDALGREESSGLLYFWLRLLYLLEVDEVWGQVSR